MIDCTQIKICEISDPAFQAMITELCDCVFLSNDDLVNQSLSFLLMAIVKEKRVLTKPDLLGGGVLAKKVDDFSTDSAVYQVCQEMAKRNKTEIESFDGKTIFYLIKDCFKSFSPPLSRSRKQTQRESDYQFQTELIKRRRRIGVL